MAIKPRLSPAALPSLAEYLQQRLGVDYVYANQLDIKDGLVTGQVSGDIIDGQRKAELLREIAAKEGLKLQQVIAVGDGANDLPMLGIAGWELPSVPSLW